MSINIDGLLQSIDLLLIELQPKSKEVEAGKETCDNVANLLKV